MNEATGNRRPLKSRDTGWARSAAAALARLGMSPDAVSAGSLVFALIGCVAFVAAGPAIGAGRATFLLAAAAAIQCRAGLQPAGRHGRGGAWPGQPPGADLE